MDRLYRAIEFKADGDTPGQFSGYGSVFDVVDSYGDVIVRGAFKDSLKEWKTKGRTPPMLLQHGGGFFGGTAQDGVPIGKWESMTEDAHGLAVTGRLIALDSERGKQVYSAMKEGALDGLSIGFRTKEFSLGTKPGEPARTLKKIDLVELSVVTMPANDDARVDGVKGMEMSERDFERWLREAGGFTREQAKTIIAKGFRTTLRDARQSADDLEAADILRGIAATFRGVTANGDCRTQGTQ